MIRSSLFRQSDSYVIWFFLIFLCLVCLGIFNPADHYVMTLVNQLELHSISFLLAVFAILGSPKVSISCILLISFWCAHKGRYKAAYFTVASLLILTGLEYVMKQTIPHPKPPLEFLKEFPISLSDASMKTRGSFPSGHALRSALWIGFMVKFLMHRRFIGFVVSFAALVMICFSLVYFGFHWPSDVIGGVWMAFVGLTITSRLCVRPMT